MKRSRQRGAPIYREYCANCHGESGQDFSGSLVGQVTDIEKIGTDRHRLDSYTAELAANQNLLYAAYPEDRFKHFRKTFGYANQPLDGLWLRAPYLHNGSVPTLRDLLNPASERPAVFYRGYDVYDPKNVGFVSDGEGEENGSEIFQVRYRFARQRERRTRRPRLRHFAPAGWRKTPWSNTSNNSRKRNS